MELMQCKIRIFWYLLAWCVGLCVCIQSPLFAQWIGPSQVISGTWGSSPGQFDFKIGDTQDSFPREFGVDMNGHVYINDRQNNRIQVFDQLGILRKVVSAPENLSPPLGVRGLTWPFNLHVHQSGNFMATFEGPQCFFYDANGNFLKKMELLASCRVTPSGFSFFMNRNDYRLYSPKGDFRGKVTTRPLELGRRTILSNGSTGYITTVAFEDKVFNLTGRQEYSFKKDLHGNLYGFWSSGVIKFDQNGQKIGTLEMPGAEFEETLFENAYASYTRIYEYGPPQLAPNGDVYTWKVTPANYSIVKWIWQD